jgi:hypothetical protein
VTIAGLDIHPTFQAGLAVGSLPSAGITFLSCKVSEGTGWYRDGYRPVAAAAKAAGLLFDAYHFLRADSPGAAQADWCRQCMGGDWGVVPVMLDWETDTSGGKATAQQARDFIGRARATGGRVGRLYCPGWYWPQVGKPSLTVEPFGSLGLIQSSYGPNLPGSFAVLYPGDVSPRWAGFGGRTPDFLQFGSRCRVPGYPGDLDVNAYRGTRAQLAATGWFYDPQGDGMALDLSTVMVTIDQDIASLSGDYKAGQQVPLLRLIQVGFQRSDLSSELAGKLLKLVTDAITAEAARDAAELARDTVEAQTLARVEAKLAAIGEAVSKLTTPAGPSAVDVGAALIQQIGVLVNAKDTPGQHAAGN